jgi:hypothetical protein
MKKIALCALLIAAAAGAAHAATYYEPTPGADYTCDYTNAPPPTKDPGLSTFDITRALDPGGKPIWRGIEYFDALWGTRIYVENRKVVFAKPQTPPVWSNDFHRWGTVWEFTINPYGPQCTHTVVYGDGEHIVAEGCSDGHTRKCQKLL